MTPITAEKALYEDLLSIYARAGAEVTYETDKGEIKAYWAKRFLQAVKRSGKQEELFELVRRLVCAEEPSRGFYILKKAGRLDLTVEALVIDREKPYYGEVDFEVVEKARRRLADHGDDDAFKLFQAWLMALSASLVLPSSASAYLRVERTRVVRAGSGIAAAMRPECDRQVAGLLPSGTWQSKSWNTSGSWSTT